MKIHNPHDALIKELLASKQNAIDFVKQFLPAEISRSILFESITQTKDTFITEELKEYFSDTILRCKLDSSESEIFICILIEHKSKREKFATIQLLTYLGQAYNQQLKNGNTLNLVVPIIFYHGKEEWEVLSSRALFSNLPLELQEYAPDFKFVFSDLVRMNDRDLDKLENEFVTATLLAQKYSQDPEELVKNLTRIFNTFSGVKNRNYIKSLIVYVISLVKVDIKDIIDLSNLVKQPVKEMIMSTYDLFIEKGIEQGIEKGIEQGIEKNTIEIVLRCHTNGFSIENIMLITGLTEQEINDIIQKNTLS